MSLRATRRSTTSRSPLKALAVLLVTIMATLVGTAAVAFAIDHPSVAPESPRRDVPIVLDGDVWKSVQFNDRVIVAGEFSQVETVRGGTVVERNNIFAYNINTGEIVDDFAPVVNGAIFDVVVDETNNTLYLGGKFTQVDGEWRIRLAKLDYFGELDPLFTAEASAQVLTLAVGNGELFLGGSFATVNGEPHDSIAAVDTVRGDNIADFNYQIAGNLGKVSTRSVRGLDINSANSRLYVAFAGQSIIDNNGVSHDRYGVAVINLNGNRVAQYDTEWFENAHGRCSNGALQIRDAELSPDESTFVVVEKGNYTCDKIVAFPAFGDGTQVDPLWVTAAHDSVFSVGISNNTVYAGGHFCFVTAHGQIDSADAATYPWVEKPEACEIGQGNEDIGDFNARQQIVALDLATGAVLDWNPTSNALVGVLDIEVIDRGLLLGQDADRVNDQRVGHHAFLDFGGTTPTYNPPVEEPFSCAASVDGTTVSVNWTEEPGVNSYVVRRDDRWIATVSGALSYDDSNLAEGEYSYDVRYRLAGQTFTVDCSPASVEVEAAPAQVLTCSVNNRGVVRWTAIDGVSTYQVRKNGSWFATVQGLSFNDGAFSAGDTYEIRYRQAGAVTDVSCN